MNITIVNQSKIPALLYGGTERVIWYLGKELTKLGHKVTYLVAANSYCDFAKVLEIDVNKSFNSQIPKNTDIVHFNFPVNEKIDKPYIITIHGNSSPEQEFDINSVFVSKNHAQRHNADSFVYNGLDWDDYGDPDFVKKQEYFHFLANAAWKVKNLNGAIKICNLADKELAVIGGSRLNFKMGFRLTTSRKTKFYGIIGGDEKNNIIKGSRGLIFPVLWDEPFGLAIIESMYFGCPVFGTPYGSLPELVKQDIGFLSTNSAKIAKAVINSNSFKRKLISEYAIDEFNSKKMTLGYLKKYEIVLSGNNLNANRPIYLSKKHCKNFIFE
ncbi:MAG: glycosyltransferase [Bacteroidales bacterium]|nr:glycosyltransferase [Bacteroidales bacterium]MDD4217338.1 glycosyltransferase [Bacteroidales bacterium]MDY0142053.1 glycosyltransferase [Bacteroidales bacterium]